MDSSSSCKGELESMPAGILVIGSHIQMDNRKEKVIFTCFISLNILPILGSIVYSDVLLFVYYLIDFAVASWWPFVYKIWEQPNGTSGLCFSGKFHP